MPSVSIDQHRAFQNSLNYNILQVVLVGVRKPELGHAAELKLQEEKLDARFVEPVVTDQDRRLLAQGERYSQLMPPCGSEVDSNASNLP